MLILRVAVALSLLFAVGAAKAQPVPFAALDYQWAAQVNLHWLPGDPHRILLLFGANFVLGEASDGIDPRFDDLRLEFVGDLAPSMLVGIPEPCFVEKGNGWVMGDPKACGLEIMYVDDQGQEDIAKGLESMDLWLRPKKLHGADGWALVVQMSFLDIRTHEGPEMLQVLGGAPIVRLEMVDDEGVAKPRELVAAGGWDTQSGMAFAATAETAETGETTGFELALKTAFADSERAFDPLQEELNLDWVQGADLSFNVFVPGGCFQPRGRRFVVLDAAGCGVQIRLMERDVGITLLELFEFLAGELRYRKNRVGGRWTLTLDLSFLDILGQVTPDFLPVYLGRAAAIQVSPGNHIDSSAPPTVIYSAGELLSLPLPPPPPPTD